MFAALPILIAEDECYLALDLCDAVEASNGKVVGPVATVAEALELLKTQAIGAAVLDARLADGDVTLLAVQLAERRVPFVIHSGTGIPAELSARLPNLPLVMKPVKPAFLLARLLGEIRAAEPSAAEGVASAGPQLEMPGAK